MNKAKIRIMNGLIKSSRGKINPNSYFMLTSRSHTFAKIQAVRLPSTPFMMNRSLQATVLAFAMVVSVSSVLFGLPQSAEAAVGDYTGFSFDTAASGSDSPNSITWDGTYFWVTDNTDAEVYKYNSNGTYANCSFDTAASGNGDIHGITWDGTSFWVTDTTDAEV